MGDLKAALGLSEGGSYRSVTVALLAVAVGLAVALLAAVGLGLDVYLPAVVLALVLVGLACLMSLNLAECRAIRRLQGGEHWVHWRYEPDEWQAIIVSEAERTNKARGQAPWMLVTNAVILGLCVASFGGTETSFWLVSGAFIGGSLLVQVLIHRLARRYSSENSPDGGEIYIGSGAVLYRPGQYLELSGFTTDLVSVDLEHGERTALRFVTAPPRRDHPALRSELRVFVPRGQESTAQDLVDRFRKVRGDSGGA
jgi:hypothetical protein